MRVITAYGVQCVVAGCRGSRAGQQAMLPGRGMLDDSFTRPLPVRSRNIVRCLTLPPRRYKFFQEFLI